MKRKAFQRAMINACLRSLSTRLLAPRRRHWNSALRAGYAWDIALHGWIADWTRSTVCRAWPFGPRNSQGDSPLPSLTYNSTHSAPFRLLSPDAGAFIPCPAKLVSSALSAVQHTTGLCVWMDGWMDAQCAAVNREAPALKHLYQEHGWDIHRKGVGQGEWG